MDRSDPDTAPPEARLEAATQAPKAAGPAPRRLRWWRHALPGVVLSLAVAAMLGAALYVLMGRPVAAPGWLRDRVAAEVAASFPGTGLEFDALEFVVENYSAPRVRMTDVRLATLDGAEIVAFSELRAGLSMAGLVSGTLNLTSLDVSGVFASLSRAEDGAVSLSGGYDLGAPTRRAASFGALIGQIDAGLQIPALASLRAVQVQALTLRLVDARREQAWTIDGGRMTGARDGDTLRLTADLALLSGGQGVATLEASYESVIGAQAASFGASLRDMAAADIAAIAAPFAWLEVLQAPISGALRGTLTEAGAPGPLSVTFSIGAGVLQPNPATRPIRFDAARAYFAYDPASGVMRLDEVSVESEALSARSDGQAVLHIGPDGTLRDIVGQITASTLSANPARLYPQPIGVDRAQVDFRMRLDPFRLEVGQAYLEDEGQALIAHGTLEARQEGWRYGLDAQMDGLTPARLLTLWPEALVPNTRAWLQDNLLAGQLRNLDLVLRGGPEQVEPVRYLSFDLEGGAVRVVPTLPPLTDVAGSASLLENRFVVTVGAGRMTAPQGGDVAVGGSSFIVPDVTVQGGAPAVVRLALAGPLEAGLSLLDQPPFEVLRKAGLAADMASGRVQAEATVALPLRSGLGPGEVGYDITGTLSDLRSAALIPGRTLEAARLDLVASQDAVRISGPGTLDGVPFEAAWSRPLGQGGAAQDSRITGTLELSAQMIDTFQIGLPPGTVSGRGTARINVTLPAGGGAPRLSLRSDLAGVGLAAPALGWRKGARTTGALRVEAVLGPQPRIDEIALDTPGLTARGAISLQPGGGLASAFFRRVQVGDWLDAPVELTGRGPGAAPAVAVRGGTLDLRRANFGGGSGGGGGAGGPLSLALDMLRVTDTIALQDFEGRFDLAGGLDGQFAARLGGAAPVTGQVLPQSGRSAVRIRSEDAGGVFAAAGLLKQARGGALSLTLLPVGEASFDGVLQVTDTRVQDAPAIAALLNAISVVGLLDELSGNGIAFNEVEAKFRLTPSRIAVTEASAVGPSMGLSMDGTYDVGGKVLDMQGVISPVYLVNGIGSLLTRKGEGLIGFNYTLSGPATAPQVAVNPLSALAPGFLREIFRRPAPETPGSAPVPEAFRSAEDEGGETAAERRQRRIDQERENR